MTPVVTALPRPFYYTTPVTPAGLLALLLLQASWWTGEEIES